MTKPANANGQPTDSEAPTKSNDLGRDADEQRVPRPASAARRESVDLSWVTMDLIHSDRIPPSDEIIR